MNTTQLEFRTANADDVRPAIELVLKSYQDSPNDLDAQVDALLAWRASCVDPVRHAHTVAIRDGRLASACLCFDAPGRVGMVWLPNPPPQGPEESDTEHCLRAAVSAAAERDLNFLQVVFEPTDIHPRPIVRRVGFRELARLDYLECPATAAVSACESPLKVEWRIFEQNRLAFFSQLIAETYRDSLDCPPLAGLRTMDDVLASHRATGDYWPEHWYAVIVDNEPAGVLLMAGVPLRSSAEIIYMGVRPAHRGRGIGRLLVEQAFRVAGSRGMQTLTLAVDRKNAPARAIYECAGFRRIESRDAWIHPLHT